MERAIAVLRVFWGLVYFSNGLAKIVPGIAHLPGGYLIDTEGAKSIITHEAKNHPVGLYHDLVFNVFVPNWGVFGPLVGVTEMTAGVLLILGLAAPLGALLGAALALHLQFATMFNNPWLFEYAVEWVPLLCLAFMRPGRFYGLDGMVWNRRTRFRAVFA